MTQGLSIIIPVLNEAENIIPLLSKINEFSSRVSFNYEIILVDGNSTDNTIQILEENLKNSSNKIYIYKQDQSCGYGSDIFFGLKKAKFDTLSWTHADLQTDLLDIADAYPRYQNEKRESIIYKGLRIKRPFLDALLTFLMSFLVLIILKTWIKDINGQPKLFTRGIFNEIFKDHNYPLDFSFDLFFLIRAKEKSFEIKTFDVLFKKRMHGIAKGGGGSFKNRVILAKRTFKYIRKLSLTY
jgi:glycosyltransferase involved in cell wall biosynthesis